MRIGQGVRTGLGHGGITCVLQAQFSSLHCGKIILVTKNTKESKAWLSTYITATTSII